MLELLGAALAGLGAGVLSGLLGIGGALLTTPVVRLLFERPGLVAVGTPLVVVIPTALAGAVAHARGGTADIRSGLVMGIAGAPFAIVGAVSSAVVGGPGVLLATAALFVWFAARMWSGAGEEHPPTDFAEVTTGRLASIGLLAGFVSGFMGLGGGFVVVPLLVTWLGFAPARAAGTSLVALAVFALPGAVTHAFLGNVEIGLAASLALGVIPGAVVGARLARRLSAPSVRRAFAVIFVAAAVVLAHNEIVVLAGG